MNSAPLRQIITMGDPLGIGPEIIAKILAEGSLPESCHYTITGCRKTLSDTFEWLGLQIPELKKRHNRYHCTTGNWDIEDIPFQQTASSVRPGPCREAGRASLQWVKRAVQLCISGEASGMITAPICKKSWALNATEAVGHTDLIAGMAGVSGRERLMLVLDSLLVVHVTCHLSVLNAVSAIDQDRIIKTIQLADTAGRSLLGRSPRIGVSGINPHAGEDGIMGSEEQFQVIPAISAVRDQGINATGPLPADTIFAMARAGDFDMVVAMLHDQGHVAVKTLGAQLGNKSETREFRGVNVTLGLPFVRTSVDHGVAFDISGRGLASPHSLMDAVNVARKLSSACSPVPFHS